MSKLASRRCCARPCLMSKSGDLSAAPSDLPGSPNHPSHPAIHTIKVAGTYVGQPAASSVGLLALLRARLAPLTHLRRRAG